MAAAEYYLGTAGAQALQNQNQPNHYPPPNQYYQQQPPPPNQQPQYSNARPPSIQPQQHFNTPPPSYSEYPLPPQELPGSQRPPQPHPHNGRPAITAPYPHSPPKYPPQPQTHQQSGYLGAPVQPIRSHSQPPRVHFEDEKYGTDSSEASTPSASDSSRHRRRRRKHRHSHSRSSSYDRGHDREHRRSHSHRDHKNRDTFLGAGGGAIIGDAIFPGLGTAAGLLLGGYGGRKHAEKRSRSESGRGSRQGWDEGTATYRKGHAIR
ncbi:hypothetical protein CC78DRAFT_294056 [Lojkania enalia]|uniref:PRP38-assoc multi-domain protein n=1 Tax=Lojkania enalia TaxID=147567 RepID=A0A9P4K6A2_9PLEO|nr:hypothetical protein CC78DRAFT_294056 [Didymosphaeria enalia]